MSRNNFLKECKKFFRSQLTDQIEKPFTRKAVQFHTDSSIEFKDQLESNTCMSTEYGGLCDLYKILAVDADESMIKQLVLVPTKCIL